MPTMEVREQYINNIVIAQRAQIIYCLIIVSTVLKHLHQSQYILNIKLTTSFE